MVEPMKILFIQPNLFLSLTTKFFGSIQISLTTQVFLGQANIFPTGNNTNSSHTSMNILTRVCWVSIQLLFRVVKCFSLMVREQNNLQGSLRAAGDQSSDNKQEPWVTDLS